MFIIFLNPLQPNERSLYPVQKLNILGCPWSVRPRALGGPESPWRVRGVVTSSCRVKGSQTIQQSTMSLKKPRQDPVSCELGRSKKLKCNRQQPCSNCKARGVTCKLQARQPPIAIPDSTPSENAAILVRLDRLEALLLERNKSTASLVPQVPRLLLSTHDPPHSETEQIHEADIKWLEDVGSHNDTSVSTPILHTFGASS